MLQFGIHTREQFRGFGPSRREQGARIAYTLLEVGENPTPEEISDFEAVCFTLRLSNGTFRTSFRNRFCDLDAAATRLIASSFAPSEAVRLEDRAVSHGLTAFEWATAILASYPLAAFEASDLLLNLYAVSGPGGVTYVAEPDGTGLQAIAPPFVVPLFHPCARRLPLNQAVARWHRRKWEAMRQSLHWLSPDLTADPRVREIPLAHPEARAFASREPRFRIVQRSVFDVTPQPCHVIRTMNILNRSYFSDERLLECRDAIFRSLLPGGLWILGRTLESSFENHASILRRGDDGWQTLERLGNGSEIEDLILGGARG